MKLAQIFLYLIGCTFAGRLILLYQKGEMDGVQILGIIFLTSGVSWVLYKMYKDIKP